MHLIQMYTLWKASTQLTPPSVLVHEPNLTTYTVYSHTAQHILYRYKYPIDNCAYVVHIKCTLLSYYTINTTYRTDKLSVAI